MSGRSRLVRVPASTANLGPGYDILGAALADELELEVTETGEFGIVSEGIDAPADRSNLVVRAFETLHPADRVSFRVRSAIPAARGLGSSAAAILAGLLAADHMFELANDREEILDRATAIEGHPDNVAAALYGGITLCPPAGPGAPQPAPVRLAPPEGVEGILVIPREEVATSAARAALPDRYPLADVTHNVAAAAQLVLGIERSDLDLIRAGLADRVHQPHRAALYPRSIELLERAAGLGALGATISGAGPTVLVWAFWQSDPGLLERLGELAAGWADVRRAQFSPRGARVEIA
ncbi:MAG: homoserine kinase [Acidobacteria bacterium]|nr:MAG: homoserine kinase [Acidobacteriota bacterium]GIK76941.1 MAG: homoserine kinase [Actinomycetes bacterium]